MKEEEDDTIVKCSSSASRNVAFEFNILSQL